MENPFFWIMMTNFTVECDLMFPSAAPTLAPSNAPSFAPSGSPSQPPTNAPSGSPSQPPTLAPTLAPSLSPTTCLDYNTYYTNVDGADHILDPYDYVNWVNVGPPAQNRNVTNFTATDSAQFIGFEFICDDINYPNGCYVGCLKDVSCLVTKLYCNNSIGCNINCLFCIGITAPMLLDGKLYAILDTNDLIKLNLRLKSTSDLYKLSILSPIFLFVFKLYNLCDVFLKYIDLTHLNTNSLC